MPQHFVLLVSKTFREKTKATTERKSMIAECLTEDLGLPLGGADQVIRTLRERGYAEKLDRHIVYYERDTLRAARDYIWGDDKRRQEIDRRRIAYTDSKFLGIECLLQDGIATREAVEAKLRELSPPPLRTEPEYCTETEYPAMPDLPDISPKSNDRITAITTLLTPVKQLFVELVQENTVLKERIARLGRERAFLNRLLNEYRARMERVAVMDEALLADAEEIARELDNAAWAQTHRLPLRTNPDKWHGQTMEIIYGAAMRANFDSKGWIKDRKLVRNRLHLYAQEGRGHNSFHSKMFNVAKGDKRLPGVPETTDRYWYHRISDGIRFYAEVKDRKLYIYNIEPKENISKH